MNMAFWDLTGDADGSNRGNYFTGEGEYDVQIESVKHRNGFKGESVIVNVEILTSNNPDIVSGSGRSAAFNLSKQPVLALNNIKSFVCGIYGLNANKKDAETKQKVNHVSKRMVEADNPLHGVKVHLTTFMTSTQKGGDFTNLDWAPYMGEPGYVPPVPSPTAPGMTAGDVASRDGMPPPPPPAAERYYPEGTKPGAGATHRLVNGAWAPL